MVFAYGLERVSEAMYQRLSGLPGFLEGSVEGF